LQTQEHCLGGRNCVAGGCVHKHPCTGTNCKHRNGPGGQTWLHYTMFKVSSTNKRFKGCTVMAKEMVQYNAKSNAKSNPIFNPKHNAITSERKMDEKIKYESQKNPEVDLGPAALDAAANLGIANFKTALASARTMSLSFAVNVYGASTGSDGYSIEEEGWASTLTTRGYDKPAIVAMTGPDTWRPLKGPERRMVGMAGQEIYDARSSKVLSKYVEKAVQQYVDNLVKTDDTLKKLWRVTGAGAPQGIGPYKVGVRFFPTRGEGASMSLDAPFKFMYKSV
jgi:hypothetical protein